MRSKIEELTNKYDSIQNPVQIRKSKDSKSIIEIMKGMI